MRHWVEFVFSCLARERAYGEFVASIKGDLRASRKLSVAGYREGLRQYLAKGGVDDRPWMDVRYRGAGNRSKRRASWILFKGACMHLDTAYDCCCEPSSYYVDPKVIADDIEAGTVFVTPYTRGKQTILCGSYADRW